MKALAVIKPEMPERRAAQRHCLFENRVKHWREIAGAGVDDTQHLGGRGLLIKRFGKLGSSLSEFSLPYRKPPPYSAFSRSRPPALSSSDVIAVSSLHQRV